MWTEETFKNSFRTVFVNEVRAMQMFLSVTGRKTFISKATGSQRGKLAKNPAVFF